MSMMKIIIENKKDEKYCCVHDTEKAIAMKIEPFEGKFELITITYEQKFFSYTNKDFNFYTITHTMDGMAHKENVDLKNILADFALEVR
jgi:hypothetical protein